MADTGLLESKPFAIATLKNPPGHSSSDTTFDLETGHAGRLPAAPFRFTCFEFDATDPLKTNPGELFHAGGKVEIIRCDEKSGDTLGTVGNPLVRALDGTSAQNFNESGKTYLLLAGMQSLDWEELKTLLEGELDNIDTVEASVAALQATKMACRVHLDVDQTIEGSAERVEFANVVIDKTSDWNGTTFLFKASRAAIVKVDASVMWTDEVATKSYALRIRKNGATQHLSNRVSSATSSVDWSQSVSGLVEVAVDDEIDIAAGHTDASSTTLPGTTTPGKDASFITIVEQ